MECTLGLLISRNKYEEKPKFSCCESQKAVVKRYSYLQFGKHGMVSGVFDSDCVQHMEFFVLNYLNFQTFTRKSVKSYRMCKEKGSNQSQSLYLTFLKYFSSVFLIKIEMVTKQLSLTNDITL
jgi:hypothetical protein